MPPNTRWIAITAYAPIVWGSTYIVMDRTLPADHPLWGGTLRALPAALILLLIVRRLPHGSWWWKSAVLGALNVGGFFVLLYVAAHHLPSSVASSIMAAAPVVMMLLAWALISEKPTTRSLAGAALGIVGVALIVTTATSGVTLLGVSASFTAMLSSSLGFVLARKWSGEVSVLSSTSWQLGWAGLALPLVAFAVEGAPPSYDLSGYAGLAYISVAATALAYVAWFTGLAHLPAGTVGIVGLLNPVSGVLLGTLVGNETLTLAQALGIGAVMTGIAVASRSTTPSRRTPEPATIGACPPSPARP